MREARELRSDRYKRIMNIYSRFTLATLISRKACRQKVQIEISSLENRSGESQLLQSHRDEAIFCCPKHDAAILAGCRKGRI